jgi:hypothetical protein
MFETETCARRPPSTVSIEARAEVALPGVPAPDDGAVAEDDVLEVRGRLGTELEGVNKKC